jgi:hypothetical protein
VDFLSNRHPAKFVSEKIWRAKEEDVEYQRMKSGVWRKYLNMCLTACHMQSPWRRLKKSA